MLDIKVTLTTQPKEKPKGKLGFGKVFTDQHLLILDAIEAGDPAEAQAKAHAHIDYLISLLDKGD